MPKGKKTPFAPWLSTKNDGIEKRYIRLASTQMSHQAMRTLKPLAFKIYCYMLLESGGTKYFEFPHSKFKDICSKQAFQDAKKELVEKGFIEVEECNKNLRKPNKYGFAERWKTLFMKKYF